MKISATEPRLSATDLANHLACRHLTSLNLAQAKGEVEPPAWRSPFLAAMRERGLEHERQYLDRLKESGLTLCDLSEGAGHEGAVVKTAEAMRAGEEVIVQATLGVTGWLGIADVLRRVDRPSNLGAWSYEAVDTKLARETSAGTILQLCLYSDLLSSIQGTIPESMHVIAPERDFEPDSYRVLDYLAYYRLAKGQIDRFIAQSLDGSPGSTYPEPTIHCEICRWFPVCDKRRRDDDHLCLVAGISKLQRNELEGRQVSTLESLAEVPLPLQWKPDRGSVESYERVREQARVQRESRDKGTPVFELMPREEGRGLAMLPEPSAKDVFFDIEGDRFAPNGGREYLFGYAFLGDGGRIEYSESWALESGDERRMFQRFIGEMMDRWEANPDFHIYHYAAYEPATLKRLMGRYAVCEEEIDAMLRAGVFVDLYAVARQAIRAGVESYSIKQLEPLFGYERDEDLREVRSNLLAVERALELGVADELDAEILDAVKAYNRDDCVATLHLRNWLESLRAELISAGESIDRPPEQDPEPSEKLTEKLLKIRELADGLLAELPEDPDKWSTEERARWRLAHLLEWHRREEKVAWWEKFRLRDLDARDLMEEKAGIAGLEFVGTVGGTDRCPIHRYSFPLQEVDLRGGISVYLPAPLQENPEKIGTVTEIGKTKRFVDIKKLSKMAEIHPTAIFGHDVVPGYAMADALFRMGDWVLEHGIGDSGSYRAARDLLLGLPPRLGENAKGLGRLEGAIVDTARRVGGELDHGVLPVQGPPGSGKTYCGARMICELVNSGKRVGVTATSHKVIRNLLEKVVEAARETGQSVTCVQKVKEVSENELEGIIETTDNVKVLTALETREAQVGGGTSWLWSRPEYFESVDVLFVDEAGQMSLANALAVAQAGKSLVLLGDPQQLEQPQQGSHPDGTDVSALEHVLGEHETIPDDRGLFLPETWRLHPTLTEFTSEVFYESRLSSRPAMEGQDFSSSTPISSPGLWFRPVEHSGNQSSSIEEVEAIRLLVDDLLSGSSHWTDAKGSEKELTLDDILVVAPYNTQVSLLLSSLPDGTRIGTVDKFQGQEAPIVIYSLTSSSPEDAPRGMEFLYNPNRLNVATSRAKVACVLVGNPRLFEPECWTPRQIKLANAFCRYLELASEARS